MLVIYYFSLGVFVEGIEVMGHCARGSLMLFFC